MLYFIIFIVMINDFIVMINDFIVMIDDFIMMTISQQLSDDNDYQLKTCPKLFLLFLIVQYIIFIIFNCTAYYFIMFIYVLRYTYQRLKCTALQNV